MMWSPLHPHRDKMGGMLFSKDSASPFSLPDPRTSLAGVSLGRQTIPEWYPQEFPMDSELVLGNLRTIRGAALSHIFVAGSICATTKPMTTFGPRRLDLALRSTRGG